MRRRNRVAEFVVLASIVAVLFSLWPSPPVALAASPDGWEWQNPCPQGNELDGVWGTSSTDVFAVGLLGTILHYRNGTWTHMSSGSASNLHAVWGSSSVDVFAVGDSGTILHYDGNAWSSMSSGSASNLRAVWGSSSVDVFAAGDSGTLLHYDGSAWSSMSSGTTQTVRGIWGSSSQYVMAVGHSGTILHYNGIGWSSMNSGTESSLHAVWGSSSTDVFAVGPGATILRYDGSTWNPMTNVTGNLNGVWGASSADVFAVGDSGIRLRRDGSSWSLMSNVTVNHLNSVWGSSADDLFAVGEAGIILHYADGFWSSMNSGVDHWLWAVWGSSSNDVFAVGDAGLVMHYTDRTWALMSNTTGKLLWDVWGSSSDDVFAVGTDGTVLHYTNSTWAEMTSGTESDLHALWGRSSEDVFAVGTYGTILHYDGSNWTDMTNETVSSQGLWGVWGSPSTDDVFAVGDYSTVLHYDGIDWTEMDTEGLPSVVLWGVWGSSPDDVFAVGSYGVILHYDGIAWSQMTSNTQELLWAVWGTSSSHVFAVGWAGTIMHYNGSDWVSMSSGTSDSLWDVWGSSPADVFVVGWYGTILHCAPTVASVTPSRGNQGEALDVIISGWNLTNTTAVSFGPLINVTGYSIDSLTQITASISIDAAATLGPRDVSVTTPEGTATLANGFTVTDAKPDIASVGPNRGYVGQTLGITIIGWNLTNVTNVALGSGVTVNGFDCDSRTRMYANITIELDAALGPRNVTVTSPQGQDTLEEGFTVTQAPATVASADPDTGCQKAEGLIVVITGANLTGATEVLFGSGITVSHFTVDSSTQITATISISAGAALGPRCISVTTPGGTATLVNGFTVTQTPPTIIGVNPDQARQGQTLDVTITGTDFINVQSVSFDAGIEVGFSVDSSTQITAQISIDGLAAVGVRNVSVTTPGGTAVLTDRFTVRQGLPAISWVGPDEGQQGETLDVAIFGSYYTGATAVSFGSGVTVNSFTVNSGTRITASITIDADAAAGARDVSVTTLEGTATDLGGFTVTIAPPTVASVSPASGSPGETLDVVITGTYLAGAEMVSFGADISVNSFDVDSPTRITAEITISEAATVGARNVSVTASGGTAVLSGGFSVEEEDGGGGNGKNGGGALDCGCGCGGAEASASATALLVGWALLGVCWGTGYYLVRKGGSKSR